MRVNRWLPAVLIAALAVIAFLPALDARFVWDDHQQLAARSLTESITRPVWQADQHLPLYRPSQMLWYHLLRTSFGLSTFAFHLGSVLLHALCSILAWRVAREYTTEWSAMLAGLLFAVHPIHIESVAWVAGVTDILCALFFFAAFLAYLNGRWLLAALLFIPAIAAKEAAIVFPLVVVADAWLSRRKGARATVIVTTILGALFLFIRGTVVGAPPAMLAPTTQPLSLFAAYLRMIVWPHPLSAFYETPPSHFWLGAAAAAAMLAIAWRFRSMRLGVIWFALTLAPPLLASPMLPAPIADRYLYLPLFGVLLAITPAMEMRIGRAIACAMIMVCSILTWQRAHVWHDDIALWSDTAARSPGIARVHYNLATALLAEERWSEAVEAFERTLALDPRHAEAHFNLAIALHQIGDDTRARKHLRTFVRLYPHNDERRRRAARLADL